MRDARWWVAGAVIVLITALGSMLDIMAQDAAEYAGMSRDLLMSGDPLRLLMRGEDYIDKPYLLFWTSALSFKWFGVHNWSYKLPSILFAFAAVYATFRLALLHHPAKVGRAAAMIFATCIGFMLMTNDVRCDTLLTGSTTCAIWLGAEYIEHRKWRHLLGCALAIGLGMLAKGPIGAVVPLLALGTPVLIQRRWSILRDPRLLAVPLLVGLMLVPLCIGYWRQHGPYGLRFYFWEQSFGRITGENSWRDDSSVFYFTHEVLWLLLPWTLFMLAGLWHDLLTWVRKGHQALPELIALCGTITVFVALSLSRYKLPHYIYPILPLACIITARHLMAGPSRMVTLLQGMVLAVLLAGGLVLTGWSFKDGGTLFVILLLAACVAVGYLFSRLEGSARALWPTTITAFALGLVLNGHVYPNILRYQANAMAGKWMAEHPVPPGAFFGFNTGGHALDYYAGHYVEWHSDLSEVVRSIKPGTVVYVDEEHRRQLMETGLRPVNVMTFESYAVQLLSLEFFDPRARDQMLSKRYLLFF